MSHATSSRPFIDVIIFNLPCEKSIIAGFFSSVFLISFHDLKSPR
ncbi:hypothetical protein SAMD00023520_00641 [Listeria monocytogenes]|nr:hypothetical protein SAMD00023518_01242 [Listeria monocytogenes]GAT40705.1 hypothetical protein SAMD00023520_00641 [Listeria monocytogenes]